MRVQVALNVKDIDASVAFYSKLFGTEPAKRRPGYANFAVENPPLKLVLFEAPAAAEQLNHIGVEVLDDAEVSTLTARLGGAGLDLAVEEGTTCCYAKANKVWAKGPDGLAWEFYKVLEDSQTFGAAPDPALMKHAGNAA